MDSRARRPMSMLKAPVADAARVRPKTRRSHSAWNAGSSGSSSTRPEFIMPPMSCTLIWTKSDSGADHRVAGDKVGQLLGAPTVGAGGTHRDHQVTQLRGRIPHPNAGGLGQTDTEISQDTAWVHHGPRAIWRRLVPDRRKAEQWPWVAGAQRADDQIVFILRVLDNRDVFALPASKTQGGDGRGGVRPQPLGEVI